MKPLETWSPEGILWMVVGHFASLIDWVGGEFEEEVLVLGGEGIIVSNSRVLERLILAYRGESPSLNS